MSETYADVDAAGDIAEAIAWQERVDAWPAIVADKRRVDARGGRGAPVLDVGYRSGTYVSALARWLEDLGGTDVTVESFPLVLDDPDDAFGLASWPGLWADRHGFTPDECTLWADAVAASRDAGFRYTVAYVVVAATLRPTG